MPMRGEEIYDQNPPTSTDDYTIVYQPDRAGGRDDPQSACLRDLICDMIERDTRSLGEIANKARMSRRQLGRILREKSRCALSICASPRFCR
jgi:AraC-like DNA-binding protein